MSSITKLYESISEFILADTHDDNVCCKSKLAFDARREAGAYVSMPSEEFVRLMFEVEQQQACVDIQLSQVYVAAMNLKTEMDKLMEVRNSTERLDDLTTRLYINQMHNQLPSICDKVQAVV